LISVDGQESERSILEAKYLFVSIINSTSFDYLIDFLPDTPSITDVLN